MSIILKNDTYDIVVVKNGQDVYKHSVDKKQIADFNGDYFSHTAAELLICGIDVSATVNNAIDFDIKKQNTALENPDVQVEVRDNITQEVIATRFCEELDEDFNYDKLCPSQLLVRVAILQS